MSTSAALSSVAVGCTDVAASEDFYRGLLDLSPTAAPPDAPEGSRWLDAGTLRLALVPAGPGADLGGWVGDDLQRGFRHLGFKVGDVDRACERVREAGIPFAVEPTDAVGDVRLAFFADPDGTLLEYIDGHLHYHRTWTPALAQREADAAAARTPEASPAFDHVAVTVADLDRSLAFYREALGFEVIGELVHEQDPRGFRIHYLQAGSAVLEVFSFTDETRPSPWQPEPRTGIAGVALDTAAAVAEVAARAERAGAAPAGHGFPWGGGTTFTDPDGVPLTLGVGG